MKELLVKAVKAVRAYLAYPSTAKGIVALASVLGVLVKPELAEHIAAAGVALFGALELFLSDADVVVKKKK